MSKHRYNWSVHQPCSCVSHCCDAWEAVYYSCKVLVLLHIVYTRLLPNSTRETCVSWTPPKDIQMHCQSDWSSFSLAPLSFSIFATNWLVRFCACIQGDFTKVIDFANCRTRLSNFLDILDFFRASTCAYLLFASLLLVLAW